MCDYCERTTDYPYAEDGTLNLNDDGETDPFWRGLDVALRIHGWTAMVVGDDLHDDGGWAYTLGLQENFGHPDLILLDTCPTLSWPVITSLAGSVAALGQLDAGFGCDGGTTVPVHPRQLEDGLVTCWEDFYELSAREGDFVQVLPPACDVGHPEGPMRLLAGPEMSFVAPVHLDGCNWHSSESAGDYRT